MAAVSLHARKPSAGMSLGELLGDTLRSPLAQALALALSLGVFLSTVGPSLGLKDTFRGASLGAKPAPAFALTDQHGQPVALDGLAGGAVVLTFVYTNCPLACPLTTSKVDQALRQLGDDARIVHPVAITVDPARDGPAELSAFAERLKLAAGWRLLSGPADEVDRVARAYHAEPIAVAARGEPAAAAHAAPTDELAHPTMVILIDSAGFQRYAYGPTFQPDDLAHDIRLLQRDLGGPTVPFPLY